MSNGSAINTDKLEAAAGFTLSRNPEHAMQEMMVVIDALRTVYMEENAALLDADTNKFMNLQDRKMAAARDYRAGSEQILQRRDEFKTVSPVTRQKLLDKHEEFSNLTSTNIEALNRMRKSVQRLSERVLAVARDTVRKNVPNYASSGNLSKQERRVSIGINESA